MSREGGGEEDLTDKIDFIECLSGDGTLLIASSLVQQSVPPVMAFNMGSLGFLTPFHFSHQCFTRDASLLLRYRLKCVVCNEGSECSRILHVKKVDKTCGTAHILMLNEVVTDRGLSPYLCNIDLYIESRLVTSVRGDGLIISTPMGSTANGGDRGLHDPSQRPLHPHHTHLPALTLIQARCRPSRRRNQNHGVSGCAEQCLGVLCWRNRQEIQQGDTLRVTTAMYPVPSVCAKDQIDDWFDGLADCLHWNVWRQQKTLPSLPSTTSLDSVILDSDSN